MIGTGYLCYVHGTRGKDLMEPKASMVYKYTAITRNPRIQKLHNDRQSCGYKPFHLLVGVMLEGGATRKESCLDRLRTCSLD